MKYLNNFTLISDATKWWMRILNQSIYENKYNLIYKTPM